MKRALFFILSFCVTLLWSMSEPASLPPELKDAKVKVVDTKGVAHELKAFRCGGSDIKFKKGNLSYKVALSSIRKMEVLSVEDGNVKIAVEMEGGKKETFELPSSTRCDAESEVGSVSFYISEIKTVEVKRGERR